MSSADFSPLVLELSLIRSHLLWGEFRAFSAANAIHNFSVFVNKKKITIKQKQITLNQSDMLQIPWPV